MSMILTRKLKCGFKTYIHIFFSKELPYFKSFFFFKPELSQDSILLLHLSIWSLTCTCTDYN